MDVRKVSDRLLIHSVVPFHLVHSSFLSFNFQDTISELLNLLLSERVLLLLVSYDPGIGLVESLQLALDVPLLLKICHFLMLLD